MAFFLLGVLLILAFASIHAAPHSVCRFPLNVENAPTFLTSPYKPDNEGYLTLKSGQTIAVTCNNGEFLGMDYFKMTELTCIYGTLVQTRAGLRNFSDFLCKRSEKAGETVIRSGACYNNYTEIEIAVNNITVLTICHNEELDETLYSKHNIFGARLNESESSPRPDFKQGDFYPTLNTDNCYKQVTQTETVGILLNSTKLAQYYMQSVTNVFLSRGHLAPNGDPIFANEKTATFYFINASPQWQSINGGNWNTLEIKTRELAAKLQSNFTVWTGSYGVLTLDDENEKPVEIWLGRNSQGALVKKLPVNKYTWKVILHESANQAVAVIQINDPWHGNVTEDDILCPNICNQLSWVTWNVQDIKLGYTICCDVESFNKAVPYAPNLINMELLT